MTGLIPDFDCKKKTFLDLNVQDFRGEKKQETKDYVF